MRAQLVILGAHMRYDPADEAHGGGHGVREVGSAVVRAAAHHGVGLDSLGNQISPSVFETRFFRTSVALGVRPSSAIGASLTSAGEALAACAENEDITFQKESLNF